MLSTLTDNRSRTWDELRKLARQAMKWPHFCALSHTDAESIRKAALGKVNAPALHAIRLMAKQLKNDFRVIILDPRFKQLVSRNEAHAKAIISGYEGGDDVDAQIRAYEYWPAFLETLNRPKVQPPAPKAKRKRRTAKQLSDLQTPNAKRSQKK